MSTSPTPRTSRFMGRAETAIVHPDGTWLESESFCYPAGGKTRKAYARCEDGVLRLVTCGIPDTFFSIPGFYRAKGKRVRGFITSGEEGFRFVAYQPLTETVP